MSSAATHQALERNTELQYSDPTRAQNGYTFFGAAGKTYLLDMDGRVVHTWPIGTNPHLLPNGHVLDASNDDPSGIAGFKEVDWDGSTVWSYRETRSTYHPHHDFERIYNPKLGASTTIYIANKDLTYAQLIAAGADPTRTPSTGAQMDAIVEVDASGTIVWEWCFFDHMIQNLDASKSSYVGTGKTIADYPGRLNINLAGHNLKGDWLHCNSLDYNQTLDQIVVNSVQGELVVIDHGGTFVAGNPTSSIALAATTAGDFLYRFGDPARYNQGSKPSILEDWTLSTTGNKQLGGAHDIQWIADGLTGAGHFLVFDNAQYLSEHTAQSYVVEINPYLDASGSNTGHYVNPPDAGYTSVTSPEVTDKTPKLVSRQVVWSYASKSNLTLFSQIGCSAQRLPNGNTLITADTEGHIMEITPGEETVWEYIVPVVKGGVVLTLGDRLPMVNSIFRAYRYEASYSAFAGRTLTAGATIAGRTTVDNPYAGTTNYQALQRDTETQYWDEANAYAGYTLFAAQGTAYLIDMEGHVVHTWTGVTDPRLLESGHILDWATTSGTVTGLKELDWNGAVVWQRTESRAAYHPHGDFRRIYDPKLGASATLYLANRDVTAAECIAAGCDPADAPYEGAQVDTVVEVDSSGNVVWEWSFWDHGIQDVDASKLNSVATGKTIADYPGKINLNLPGRPLRSNWLDCNSLDYNATLDQIVVNSRQGELYVIDHGNTFVAGNPTASIALAATSAGDFLYRFGDPARYKQGNAPSVGANWEQASSGNKQIGGSSNAQWIATGLPGAGHLLLFDNNQYLYQRTPQSYVFEINPYRNASGADTGSYVNPPTAGYTSWTFDKDTHKSPQQLSNQVVWKYGSLSNLTLFSHFGSSVQRLPNGNTLICATTQGYFLEVDSSGNDVWEYINPVTASGVVTAIGDNLPMTNAVPRAVRYAADFAGFTGHDLTPGPVITELPTTNAPTAAFSYAPTSPVVGQAVTFTDASTGTPTSWSWAFGDGATSTQQSPTHAFSAAGAYTVTLTATNAGGSSSVSHDLTVAAAPEARVLYLPAVAHAKGVGATFTSRVEMLNTSSAALGVTVRYTPRADIAGSARTATITVPAGQSLTVDDPLALWFGFGTGDTAVGSVRFSASSGSLDHLLVQSVVTAHNTDGSEYGQDLPALTAEDAIAAGETAYLASLVDATRTRINFAAMGLDDGTVLTVQPVDPIGTPLAAARTLTLNALVSTQLNDLNRGANGFGLGAAADYLLEVKVSSGRALVWASVLDGTSTVPGTSDPTTILPVKAGAAKLTLLQLGPAQGYSEYSGSAQISNLGTESADLSAELYLRGTPGVAATASLTIPAGDTVGYQDLVSELLHGSGVGTVVLRGASGARLMATGREFSIQRDAGQAITGTAGNLIPGMTDDELLEPGVTYHLLGLRQRTVGTGLERSHIAAFNPGSADGWVTVTLVGASGSSEGTLSFPVAAGELVQLNNVIERIDPAQDGATKQLEVTVDHSMFVKAFRVNAWGDPITIDALAE